MRTFHLLLSGYAMVALALVSCKSSNTGKDLSQFIPSESAMVVAFQPGNLLEKLDYATLDTMQGYKYSLQSILEENETLAAIIKDPKQSGILLGGTAYLVGLFDPSSMEASGFFTLLNLEDAGKFSTLLASASTEKPGNLDTYKSLSLASGAQVVWNNDLAILSLFSGNSPEQLLKKFLQLPEKNNLKSNKTMYAALDPKADISLALTTDPLAKSEMVQFLMGMAKMDVALLQGNFMKGVMNFGKTKAELQVEGNFSNELKKLLSPLFNGKVEPAMAGYVPGDIEGTVAVLSFNPQGISQTINSNKDLEGMVEMLANENNIDFNILITVGNGQIIFVPNPNSPKVLHYVALGITKTDLVAALLPKFSNSQGVKAREIEPGIFVLPHAFQPGAPEVSYYYTLAGNYLLLSDELELIHQGKTGNNQGEFQKEFKTMSQYPIWTVTQNKNKIMGHSRGYWDGNKGSIIYENESGKAANSLRSIIDASYLQFKNRAVESQSPALIQ